MSWWEEVLTRAKSPLAILGFTGQLIFFMRFLVQWLASEKAGRSMIPIAFWYLSIGGSVLLLLYGILDRDPVIILGQAIGCFVYLRNLALIRKAQKPTT
jgi:lipid-A-disaccharide synthase-like uncharacterized protein